MDYSIPSIDGDIGIIRIYDDDLIIPESGYYGHGLLLPDISNISRKVVEHIGTNFGAPMRIKIVLNTTGYKTSMPINWIKNNFNWDGSPWSLDDNPGGIGFEIINKNQLISLNCMQGGYNDFWWYELVGENNDLYFDRLRILETGSNPNNCILNNRTITINTEFQTEGTIPSNATNTSNGISINYNSAYMDCWHPYSLELYTGANYARVEIMFDDDSTDIIEDNGDTEINTITKKYAVSDVSTSQKVYNVKRFKILQSTTNLIDFATDNELQSNTWIDVNKNMSIGN